MGKRNSRKSRPKQNTPQAIRVSSDTETGSTVQMEKAEYTLANIISNIHEVHGELEDVNNVVDEKTQENSYSLHERENDIPSEVHCNKSNELGYTILNEIPEYNVDKCKEKNEFLHQKNTNDRNKGAIPKIVAGTMKAKFPSACNFEHKYYSEENGQNSEDPLSFALEMASIAACMMTERSRVPYISDPAYRYGNKRGTIYLKTMFTEDEHFYHKANNSIASSYELICLKELKEPEEGFVTLEPGVFVLAIGLSYADDYQIIRTVYPSLRSGPKTNQAEEKVYLLEKRILRHLENFRTELLCSIFQDLLEYRSSKAGYITEFDYLMLMKQKFHYSLFSIHDDLENYSAKEFKSKFCPGRNSKIERLFQKQTFR